MSDSRHARVSATWTSSTARRARARLQTKRALKRFLRRTSGGPLRIDRGGVRAEQHLDGKFLLRSSDPTLTAEDNALGCEQLLQVEAAGAT